MHKVVLILGACLAFSGCAEKNYTFEFVEINTPGSSSFRAICATDENTVWTSGSQGQVFLTEDGGQHWKQMTVPGCEDTELRSLHAWDASRALVFDISPLGRAFMTLDGGQSWEQVYQSPVEGAFFNSVKFADGLQGLAISDPIDDHIFVISTKDGGLNWERLANLPLAVQGEINFAASNTCIEYLPGGEIFVATGGSKSRILNGHHHGETWDFVETPVMDGESAGLFSVAFSNPTHGVAVGGDFSQPDRKGIRAIYTKDGGESWQAALAQPAEYRSCVVSLGKDLFFAIGKTGCDYSSDQGMHWNFIDFTGYYAADAAEGENILYVAGANGRVAKVKVRKN